MCRRDLLTLMQNKFKIQFGDLVIDNTLQSSSPDDIYHGIRFNNSTVFQIQSKLKYYGFLSSPTEPNYELALSLDPTLIDLLPDMSHLSQKKRRKR